MVPLLILGCCLATILFIVFLLSQKLFYKRKYNLPPGKTGWPIIGETLSYVASPTSFIRKKMTKYSTTIFRTYFFGHNVVFICGPAANKFVFSKDGKFFKIWAPDSLSKLLSLQNYPENSELQLSWQLLDDPIHKFFKLDTLRDHVNVIDSITREHIDSYWVPHTNKELKIHSLTKEFTFYLTCRVFLDYSNSIPEQIRQLAKQFFILSDNIFTVPVNFPGTPYYRANKASPKVREMIVDIVKQRREEAKTMSPADDVLGQILLATAQANGQVYSDQQIASKFIGYLFAGFYSTSSAIAYLLCHLAQHPLIFEKVLQEQLEIVKDQREPSKLLSWGDVQKMKYSWNVVRESLRLLPHPSLSFREVITDFTYEGYTIPKGWKVGWDAQYTNTDPNYFKDPEKFDPSRFEEKGPSPYTYVPFGGGPRMCKGNEFARISLLVFLHNVVTKFRLEEIDSKDPLLIRLQNL